MSDDQSQLPKEAMHSILQALGGLERAANASILGYFTQILYSTMAWLELGEDEVLVVEGREDLDRFIISPEGCIQEVTESQIKALNESVNARSPAVWESIFNFLLSYQYHRKADRRVRMVLATTASMKKQTTSHATGVRQTSQSSRLDLEVDVLQTWSTLHEMDPEAREQAVGQLAQAVRGLFEANLRKDLDNSTAAKVKRAREILEVIETHDANSTWSDFFGSVKWLTDLDSAPQMAERLKTRIAEDSKLHAFPAEEFMQVLVYYVLEAASKPHAHERFLTASGLHSVATRSAESLRQWAASHGLVHLGKWHQFILAKVVEHGHRLDNLEATLPTQQQAVQNIRKQSEAARRRVHDKIGGVHLVRHQALQSMQKILMSSHVLVVLGSSGVGKSALVRNLTEHRDESGGLTMWLDGASLGRPDLAALQSDWMRGLPVETVFHEITGPRTLVVDGLDRVFESSAMSLFANLVDVLQVGRDGARCDLVITCQTVAWPRLKDQLTTNGIDPSAWNTHECTAPSPEELKLVWDAMPPARRLVLEPRLNPLVSNLKILDLIARRISDGDVLDVSHFHGETSIASWFWNTEVAKGPKMRSREAVLLRLGALLADQLKPAISITDDQLGDTSVLDELERDRICVIDDRQRVRFEHDLYADWARLRVLLNRENDLLEYLRTRLDSPLWHGAIRLVGVHFLDENQDAHQWNALLRNLKEAGGDSIADLLLESIFFSVNSRDHLELIARDLLSPGTGLLNRLLGRFLASATRPDPHMLDLGRSLGVDPSLVAAHYRSPVVTYWIAVLHFLHTHRDRAILAAPERVEKVASLWLKYSPSGFSLRREAAELGLLLGQLAVQNRWGDRKYRQKLFSVALAGVPEREEEVTAFALRVAERSTAQEPDDPSWSRDESMDFDFEPDEPLPAIAPDGPRNRVDDDFRSAVLDGQALRPLMSQRPEIAREVILACLLSARHRRDSFSDSLDESSIDLESTPGHWTPSCYFRGPFRDLLQYDFAEGLETIARLVDYLANRWRQRREENGVNDQFIDEPESSGLLHTSISGVPQTFVGDARTLGWSAGLGQPFPSEEATSALMALEQHLNEAIDSEADVVPMVQAVLDRAGSVPMLQVLLDVGRKKQSLFEGPLLPLLGIPELYLWDTQILMHRRTNSILVSPFESESTRRLVHEFGTLPHRRIGLRDVALQLFQENENVCEFLTNEAVKWKDRLEKMPPGREHGILEHLVMLFKKEKYQLVDNRDGATAIVNIALEERYHSMREEIAVHEEVMTLHFLPDRCRRLLEEKASLPDTGLQQLVDTLNRIEAAMQRQVGLTTSPAALEKSANLDELDRPFAAGATANALAGGIAVLLCLHYDWVDAQPELLDWCRETLKEIVTNELPRSPNDVHTNVLDWTWDCFAAEALVALWQRSPQDIELRRMVARLAFSFHNTAVGLLIRRAASMIPVRFDDLQRLRRLVFDHAAVRNRLYFLHRMSLDHEGQVQPTDVHAALHKLEQWSQSRMDAFSEGRSEMPASNWSEMGIPFDSQDLEDLWRTHSKGRELDFKLIQVAHEAVGDLLGAPTSEERAYRVRFLQNGLDFWHAIVSKKKSNDHHWYPNENARWLLEQSALAVTMMTPEEQPCEYWERILALPAEAHHWAEVFLTSFFEKLLSDDPLSQQNLNLAVSFIAKTTSMPAEKRWESGVETWQALFGVHRYTRPLWKEKHAKVAAELWPSKRQWISQERVSPRHLVAVTQWLLGEAATRQCLEGIGVLRSALSCGDSGWPEYDREPVEDSVASLLRVIWEKHATALRQSEAKRQDFLFLLRWLTDRQHALGLELAARIGKL